MPYQKFSSATYSVAYPLLALAIAAIAACNEPPQVFAESGPFGQGEWQLVDREYPYTGEHGEMVCAEWEWASPEAPELTDFDREFYHPEVMTRQLDGEPLPGEEISVEILDAIRSAGITSVETCEDARRFLQLKREIIESEPFTPENHASTGNETPLPGAVFDEESVGSNALEEIDKVIDSQIYNNPPTVGIRVWNSAGVGLGGCSGTLIGPRHLLTAAHCFPADGTYRVSVTSQGGASCVSSQQPTPGDCLNAPMFANVFVTRRPGYSGSGDTGDDMAIVQQTSNWLSPANTSSSWMRINNMPGALSANYWVSGYGANSWNGQGFGTGRLALQAQPIDWAGSQHWYSTRDSYGVGAPCSGDSGSPAITTGFGFDLNVGVESNSEKYLGHSCPSVEGEHKFRYAHPGRVGTWIDSTVTAGGGVCTDFVHNNVWHYLRCW